MIRKNQRGAFPTSEAADGGQGKKGGANTFYKIEVISPETISHDERIRSRIIRNPQDPRVRGEAAMAGFREAAFKGMVEAAFQSLLDEKKPVKYAQAVMIAKHLMADEPEKLDAALREFISYMLANSEGNVGRWVNTHFQKCGIDAAAVRRLFPESEVPGILKALRLG